LEPIGMLSMVQGDKLYSELFNELYQFNFDSRRWFPMVVRPPRKEQPSKQEAAEGSGSSGEAAAAAGQQQAQDGSAGGSSGAGPGEGRQQQEQQQEQQQQQRQVLPGVSPEMSAILQKAMADKNSVFFRAAVRIQARYRGYVVRKVRCWHGPRCVGWCES
jgi:hypothetical protein